MHKLAPDFCTQNLVLPLRREGIAAGRRHRQPRRRLPARRRQAPLGLHVRQARARGRRRHPRRLETMRRGRSRRGIDVDDILADVDEDDVEVVKDVEAGCATLDDAESSPVVRYVNHIIQTALKEGASDIHIEPDEKTLKVRFRIDGVLFEMMNPPREDARGAHHPHQDHGRTSTSPSGACRRTVASGRRVNGTQARPPRLDAPHAQGREDRHAYSRQPSRSTSRSTSSASARTR